MTRRAKRKVRSAVDWHTAIADRVDLIFGAAFVVGVVVLIFTR